KERDHDDRFRARSRTQGRDVAGRIDLPGLLAALSAYHDDNGGGLVRRVAAGPREWDWQRAAAPTRHLHRWRFVALAISHALHPAGHLSLSRSLRALGRGTPEWWPS